MHESLVPVEDCKIGDIIAREVVNASGIKLIAKNAVINEYIREKLMDFGAINIWIYDTLSDCSLKTGSTSFEEVKNNYIASISSVRKILLDLSSDKELDFGTIKEVSNLIFSGINGNEHIIKCLSEIRNNDEYTYSHCVNTAFYAMLIGRWLKLDEANIRGIIQAGLLHDIGKVRIPKMILNKKGRLDSKEFDEIKKHTLYGYDIVRNIKEFDSNVKDAVLMHHERMNGSGYPYGVAGESIGLFSKIVAIADVYDAMTSERVYKKRVTPFEAFKMFITDGKIVFDVDILKVFLNNICGYYIGAEVLLNNGDTGSVAYVPPYDIASPIIFTKSNYIDLSREKEVRVLSLL